MFILHGTGRYHNLLHFLKGSITKDFSRCHSSPKSSRLVHTVKSSTRVVDYNKTSVKHLISLPAFLSGFSPKIFKLNFLLGLHYLQVA